MSSHLLNARPRPDQVLVDIADYVTILAVSLDQAALEATPVHE
jgi:hypothetical protein